MFDFQDRLTESVAIVVDPHIQQTEIERARRDRPGSIAAYDLYLQALPKILAFSAADNADAFALLSEAMALEPDNAIILASAAVVLSSRDIFGWVPIGTYDLALCANLTRRALQYAAQDATVGAYSSSALMHFVKDYDWAMSVMQSAAATNPNRLQVVFRAGVTNLHCGDPADAPDLFRRAIRLSPRDPFACRSLTLIAHVYMILGAFDEALIWAARSLTLSPNYQCTFWMLIAANAQLGRMDEAREYLTEFRNLAPGVTIASIWAGQPQKDPSRCAAILEGLRLVGLADCKLLVERARAFFPNTSSTIDRSIPTCI